MTLYGTVEQCSKNTCSTIPTGQLSRHCQLELEIAFEFRIRLKNEESIRFKKVRQ